MNAILLHLTGATEQLASMALTFAKASSSILAEANDTLGVRPTAADILFRGLMLSQPNQQTFHDLTRNLTAGDIRSIPQATQTLAVPYVLRAIEDTPDIHPIYLADMLSILAALGAHSSALQKTMAQAWARILTHPNVKHGDFLQGVEAESRLLLFRMAQNDAEWTEKTALLLNRYQAEQEKESWEGVLGGPDMRFSSRTRAGCVFVCRIPLGFTPENGLSFVELLMSLLSFS